MNKYYAHTANDLDWSVLEERSNRAYATGLDEHGAKRLIAILNTPGETPENSYI